MSNIIDIITKQRKIKVGPLTSDSADAVNNTVDEFLSNGVVTTSIYKAKKVNK